LVEPTHLKYSSQSIKVAPVMCRKQRNIWRRRLCIIDCV